MVNVLPPVFDAHAEGFGAGAALTVPGVPDGLDGVPQAYRSGLSYLPDARLPQAFSQPPKKSNSPLRTPERNASHSLRV